MSRRNGYHDKRWIGVKRLRHRILQNVLTRLFNQVGIRHKYYSAGIPDAEELQECLSEAWRRLEDKPRQILELNVWVTRREGEFVDLVLITAVMHVENQAVSRRKSYTVCGTPKGYMRAVNGD